MKLFWACLIALVATSFVFGVRSDLIGDWAREFKLSEAEKGQILGVGLWPFALSIIFFSFVIDRIGYKTAAFFAIACHLVAVTMTVFAKNKQWLYWGTFVVSLGNGTVEAFINPVVATVFRRQKAKWLNILHAGWPAGIALGVVFSLALGTLDWRVRFALCYIPVIIYTLMILPRHFPVQERVAAGVSYRDMLREVGAIGFFMVGFLVTMGVSQMFNLGLSFGACGIAAAVIAALAGAYTHTLGNPLFLVILVTMGPLATTELGTDTWMPDLLKSEVGKNSGLVLAYSAMIMTLLRSSAGPIVHKFSPIGLLVISAAVAICGLLFLSQASGLWMIVLAATLYAFGKTFLWSTTLGMVSEQFPKGGALTLNGVSAVGVLGMGIMGSVAMGYFQDVKVGADINAVPGLHQKVAGIEKETIFGKTPSVDPDRAAQLMGDDARELNEIQNKHRKGSFLRVAALPAFMLACYLGIFFWFKSKGGYKPIVLGHPEEAELGF
ncbi:MAG TPA: MFS transporter [Verrucomicrobiaceae bacterium]